MRKLLFNVVSLLAQELAFQIMQGSTTASDKAAPPDCSSGVA
jgi:hypothetical protein